RERRVALVHERFTEIGGSERVVEQFHRIWPDAPVYASVAQPEGLPEGLVDADVRPSALQRLHSPNRSYAALLPFLPMAMARLDLADADLVVVSHHAFANRVRPPDGTPVISYTHTPARWIWEPELRANEIGGPIGRAGLGFFARTQRRADRAAAGRLTGLVVNSTHVAERVRRYWERDAVVVPPPVDTEFYVPDRDGRPREDFFLLAGRLVPYKQPEIAVAAAERAGVRLVVAGDGRARPAVEAAAGPHTELLGRVDDDTLRDLYRRCRALVFPGEEDFGIVPVEAQACGAPVIARRIGGVLDSVVDGTTGVLYEGDPEDVGALAAALTDFDAARFDPDGIRAHADGFSRAAFRERFAAEVDALLA
ncbi:MAG TPA: glycosyltransferase, partial [Acidimicrobiales bacterium]|nr:glycosyltransferase [Acidimicrobiales bacterium]